MAESTYQLHPLGGQPIRPVRKIEDDFFQQLAEQFAGLEAELVEVKAQLESTEKAYDTALQQNIELQDRVTRLEVGSEIDEEIINALDEMVEPVHVHLSGNETVESVRVGSLSQTTVAPTPPRPEMSGIHHMDTVGEVDEHVNFTLNHKAEIQAAALKKIQPLSNRVELAEGKSAQFKDQLIRSQNANRRYKARIKRQRLQLDALQELANAAFPLYLKVSDALGQARINPEVEFLVIANPKGLEQECIDFHNAFNKAAEALTPPRRVVDGLEIRYER